MRRFIRNPTPEEEALVRPLIAETETLLGVHDSQNMYAIRQADGGIRFIDYNSVKKPGIVRRVMHSFSGA